MSVKGLGVGIVVSFACGATLVLYILCVLFFAGWGFFEHIKLIEPDPIYSPATIAAWMFGVFMVLAIPINIWGVLKEEEERKKKLLKDIERHLDAHRTHPE